ncbi:MAG: protein kinase domain-containing protein [Solirubrobacteraceae bacterium]
MPGVLKRVGRFDLLEVIGRGGAAVVYLALQRDLDRHVALKELASFHLADASFAQRFIEESRLVGAMNHANVVTVHEFFEDGSIPYIAMEHLPHGSLRRYIGRLTLAQIAAVLEGVLAGLAHGEAHGVVHRDVKPENLLVAGDGRVKISDFGVARAYSQAAPRQVVTVAGTTIGTPAYMSPEQALGSDLTPATDLYSLGVVAWELLAGSVPFQESDTPVAVLYRHVNEPVPSVRTVKPEVDKRIAAWLERMLAKRPEDRFQSADAAWMALEDIVLELLGPRWRRQARLVLDGDEPGAGRMLTPAPFDRPAARPPARGATPIPETLSGPAAGGGRPAATPALSVPGGDPQPEHMTIVRPARRHHAAAAQQTEPADRRPRRPVVAAVVVAVLVAAAIGVVVAMPSAPTRHGPSKAAQQHAATVAASALKARRALIAVDGANAKLATIVGHLGSQQKRAIDTLAKQKTPTTQTAKVAAVHTAYTKAARSVAKLSSDTPAAKPLAKTLNTTGADFGRLRAAGRRNSQRDWDRARAAISRDQRNLQKQVRAL